MSDVEMFTDYFPTWLLMVLVSFAVTFILYGIGPFLFCRFQKSTVSAKKFNAFCVLYTIAAFIALRLIGWTTSSNVTPAFLWGFFFNGYFSRKVKKKNQEIAFGSETAAPAEDKEDPTDGNQDWPLSNNEFKRSVEPEPDSFYESEKRKEKSVYSPLDAPKRRSIPPEYTPGVKMDGRFWFRVLSLLLIFCLGCLSVYGAYRSSVLSDQLSAAQVEAQNWKEKYNTLKRDYSSLKDEYADVNNKLSRYDDDYWDVLSGYHFFNSNIGFIVSGSNYYHNFECEDFQNANEYWAHNVEYCEYLGYKKCPHCW